MTRTICHSLRSNLRPMANPLRSASPANAGSVEKPSPAGATNYDNQANQLVAKNLKGHLLLAHGTMDNNVPPYNTLLVVNELIKANKDFDLILLPNRGHGFGSEPYMVRRRWDYFVRYLLGAEPPQGYELAPASAAHAPPPP